MLLEANEGRYLKSRSLAPGWKLEHMAILLASKVVIQSVRVLFIYQGAVCKAAFLGEANLLKTNLESKHYVD